MLGFPAVLLCVGAFAVLFIKPHWVVLAGSVSAIVGCAAAMCVCVCALFASTGGVLEVFFALPIVILGIAGAIYSIGYLKGHSIGRVRGYWLFFNVMLAAMFCVLTFEQPVRFLLAWEMMGVASAALVAFDIRSRASMRAVWIYLAACHAGAACLIVMFLQLAASAPWGGAVFVLALLGFGLKAGFAGLHVWLPEAHPAAPAPVSAIMSGAMINLGLFGILKYVVLPGCASDAGALARFGWTFFVLGIAGTLIGILFAMPQRDLKRLLAFSSIENMGVVTLAIGLALLGAHSGNATMARLAAAGAALHLFNHALLKGGLFFGAGSVYRATGTLDMDVLGGLMRRMPRTGRVFACGAIGLSGLPPLNGFAGEFFIYLAAFEGIAHASGAAVGAGLAAALVLTFAGGLAVATFTKVIGAVFLGEPRSEQAASATEVSPFMIHPARALLTMSILTAFVGPLFIAALFRDALGGAAFGLVATMGAFGLLSSGLIWLRIKVLTRGRAMIAGPTWDCGYARPTARMAYTGTAFTQPLVDLVAPILRPQRRIVEPEALFPTGGSVEVSVEDAGTRWLWGPLFGGFARIAQRLHAMQSGSLHAYVLAMVVAVVALVIWALVSALPEQPPPLSGDAIPSTRPISMED